MKITTICVTITIEGGLAYTYGANGIRAKRTKRTNGSTQATKMINTYRGSSSVIGSCIGGVTGSGYNALKIDVLGWQAMKQPVLRSFFYPYIPAMINNLERWLSKKASDGWRLEAKHGWNFAFRKCSPYTAKFFSYSGFGTDIGISNDYGAFKKRYSRRKATINKPDSAICEVDIKIIDSDYNHFVSLRNKFYLKHYVAMLLFALVYTAFAIGLTLMNSDLVAFSVFGIILLYVGAMEMLH